MKVTERKLQMKRIMDTFFHSSFATRLGTCTNKAFFRSWPIKRSSRAHTYSVVHTQASDDMHTHTQTYCLAFPKSLDLLLYSVRV